jgi:hypothetical protein
MLVRWVGAGFWNRTSSNISRKISVGSMGSPVWDCGVSIYIVTRPVKIAVDRRGRLTSGIEIFPLADENHADTRCGID